MRIKTRTATALGALALTATSVTGLALSGSAQAAERDGICDEGEFCYNFSSDMQGAWSDFTGSVADYGTDQPSCFEFKGEGNGSGDCVKNDAAAAWNRSDRTVTVFFNSKFGGESQQVAPGEQVVLNPGMKNNNASHRFDGEVVGVPTPPAPAEPPAHSGEKQSMSQALYAGGGGDLECNFDKYENTPGRHEGIDFAKGAGSTVLSLVDGEVIRSGGDRLGTLAIYVPSADKTVIYLHAEPTVGTGTQVRRGQPVATESTLATRSVHTHVEVRDGRQTHAAKSVNDYRLDNANPTPFWESQGYSVD